MQAVIEAAENLGVTRIIKRRCNVFSIGVYMVYGGEKRLLYIDWGKEWSRNEIYERIVSSLRSFHKNGKNDEIVLTIA